MPALPALAVKLLLPPMKLLPSPFPRLKLPLAFACNEFSQ
jgi:hypothetical protein